MSYSPGRQYDLEEIFKERQKAKNAFERDRWDKMTDKILRESGEVREQRENLIKAIRGNDIRAIKRANLELERIKKNENYGRY